MPLKITFEDHELPALREMLDRAMNCWEPTVRPAVVDQLSDAVDRRIVAAEEEHQERQEQVHYRREVHEAMGLVPAS